MPLRLRSVLAAASVSLILVGCGTTTNHAVGRATTSGKCSAQPVGTNDYMADKRCTPGAIDPRVNQSNIHQTVCVRGYTGTVRPPVSYTNRLKKQGISDYGNYRGTNLSAYEEDHLISLSLGGAPSDPQNLWPEFPKTINDKDKVEFYLYHQLCQDKITLKDAQVKVLDWYTTFKTLPSSAKVAHTNGL